MATPPTRPRWRIVSQREDVRPGAGGTIEEGVVVTFQGAGGVVGTVFVPALAYAPDEVRRLVDEKVAAMEAVQALTGT